MIQNLEPRDVEISEINDNTMWAVEMCGHKLKEVARQIKVMRKLIISEPARFDKFPDPAVRKRRMDEEANQLRESLKIELDDLNVKLYTVFAEQIKIDTWKYMWDCMKERDALTVEESRKLMN